MKFIETPVFTKDVRDLLSDENEKSSREDLTPAQIKTLRRLVRAELG